MSLGNQQGSEPDPKKQRDGQPKTHRTAEDIERLFDELNIEDREALKEFKERLAHPLRETLNELRESFLEKGRVLQKNIKALTVSAKNQAETKVKTAGLKIVDIKRRTQKKIRDEIKNFICNANEKMCTTGSEHKSTINELARIAPLVSGYGDYADGWKKWHNGEKKEGRELCVAAWLSAGFDIGSLGTGLLARKLRWVVRAAVVGVTAAKAQKVISKFDLNPFIPVAKLLLKNSKVETLTDSFLRSISPKDKADEELNKRGR